MTSTPWRDLDPLLQAEHGRALTKDVKANCDRELAIVVDG